MIKVTKLDITEKCFEIETIKLFNALTLGLKLSLMYTECKDISTALKAHVERKRTIYAMRVKRSFDYGGRRSAIRTINRLKWRGKMARVRFVN